MRLNNIELAKFFNVPIDSNLYELCPIFLVSHNIDERIVKVGSHHWNAIKGANMLCNQTSLDLLDSVLEDNYIVLTFETP